MSLVEVFSDFTLNVINSTVIIEKLTSRAIDALTKQAEAMSTEAGKLAALKEELKSVAKKDWTDKLHIADLAEIFSSFISVSLV